LTLESLIYIASILTGRRISLSGCLLYTYQ